MKKLLSLSLLLTFTLSLTACSSNSWQADVSYLKPEQIEKANQKIEENLELLKEDSQNPEAYFQLGFYYQTLGDYKEAEKNYLKSLELNDQFTTPYNNLAAIYEEVGETQLAADAITKLYTLSPPSILEAVNDAVRIHLANKDPDSAEKLLTNFTLSIPVENRPEFQSFISEQYETIRNYRQK